jgi:hypothetical protein
MTQLMTQPPHDRHEGADTAMAAPEDRRQEPGDELEGVFYQPNANQRRHEPMPASPQDDKRQEAVRQNEAYAHGYAQRESREGQGEVPGELTPGPEDPGTPPTHATGGEPGDGRVGRIRRVARAVRGRPDGEVDPHS